MSNDIQSCDLCMNPGGAILWQSPLCRVVRVDDPHYPGFCRVIWNHHVREMTDLAGDQQALLMRVVFAVESVLRELFRPDKINLASFGNMVPHVHWHVIARWQDDRHFPEPIWGSVRREIAVPRAMVSNEIIAAALAKALANTDEGWGS